MDIVELEGEDPRLYNLVAHLVMDTDVLAYNLNYPFRTSADYRWFIAADKDTTLGFVPVRISDGRAVINNYYVADDDTAVFSALLQRIIDSVSRDLDIESVSQTRHMRFFEHNGFSVVHYWKRYVKMRVYRNEGERV